MPTTPMKNLLYRAALPFLAPSVHKKLTHACQGQALNHLTYYEHLLVRHHVCGASLLLWDGERQATVHTSCREPDHPAREDTIYRVASITKMATALVTLMLCEEGCFTLDTLVSGLLPEGDLPALQGVTLRHLLCHTSGLRDTPALDRALREGEPFHAVLKSEGVRGSEPGDVMAYSNLGFGLLGCVLEKASGKSIEALFQDKLFHPLGMRATLDGSTLEESCIMPISRVLPYRKGQDVRVTRLGRIPIDQPDPLRHFGHTAGAMYTDCASLKRLLTLIHQKGVFDGKRLLSEASIREMTTRHAATSTRVYGLGLVLLEREWIQGRMLGHQGFAYGCVDGAFVEEDTGRMVIFLNGGASEARNGRLGLVNQDVLRWALTKEMPSWK